MALNLNQYENSILNVGNSMCNRDYAQMNRNTTTTNQSVVDEKCLIVVFEESEFNFDDMDPDYVPSSAEVDEDTSPEGEYYNDDTENMQADIKNDPPQTLSLAKDTSENRFGILKSNGEMRRWRKQMDYCFYCESYNLNFARHVQRNHAGEIEVKKIMCQPPKSKERRNLLDKLRKKGNYLNSNEACKPVQRLRVANELLPCDNCLGFFSSRLLWRHRNKCTGKKTRDHQSSAQNILLANLKVDAQLRKFVFPKMRGDDISLVAKSDSLICAYGARYMKIHREKHFINVTSRKMRELGRLLIEVRKREPSIKSLFDALKPKHFDLLVAATKSEAKYDMEKDKYKSPTYALNMGTTLKQCAEIAIIFALKRKQVTETIKSAEAEADLKTLIQVIESQWKYEISSQATNDLNINKWNKITIVPLASDIKLLKDALVAKAKQAVEGLHADVNVKDFINLLETIYCRLILLNRRRPGELQRLSLDLYEQAEINHKYEEFEDIISPSERILIQKFKRIVIRGKRGRGVPVLFSPDTQEHINILLKYRHNFIKEQNSYLFANPKTSQPICGYKVLNKYAVSCGAKNPDAITSTKLRKHLATLTQIFSMSDTDLEQLANFMGHTIGVHKNNYRLPDDVYQTAKISKLLLLMESGGAAEFKGKPLNEIELNLDEDINAENPLSAISSDNEVVPEIYNKNLGNIKKREANKTTVTDICEKKKRRILMPWTEEQKTTVTNYFSTHIKNKKPPKKYECELLKNKYPDLLQNKDWLKIKVYIQNEYSKKKN
ncbi:unnamed protein product [Brassicogethes aeneus]|uniref:Uncharacterized protein n=1 Tax=Brassicogethes aeneus TaxID=1431903 RepID=A0A9P0BGX4_BRAAE|nr:unnamed protein product [Brassicogethes aeneus]